MSVPPRVRRRLPAVLAAMLAALLLIARDRRRDHPGPVHIGAGGAGDRRRGCAPRSSASRCPAAPGVAAPIELDATLYLPETTPAPAVLVAHGFGGSKASVDADARDLAARGFVVLAWSARGFGTSGGQIALNSPDYEVADARALVDWLAARPEVVAGRSRRPAGRASPAAPTAARWRCCSPATTAGWTRWPR